MSELIVITYDTEQEGYDALAEVQRLQKMQMLALEDAAVAVKNQKGKVKVKQTLEKANTGMAASWGLFWGLLIDEEKLRKALEHDQVKAAAEEMVDVE